MLEKKYQNRYQNTGDSWYSHDFKEGGGGVGGLWGV